MLPWGSGYPLNSFFSYRFAGLDPERGDPLGYLDGEITKDYLALQQAPSSNLVYEGTALPQYFGSFRNEVGYKQLSLSINITYRFDYVFRRNTVQYSALLNANAQRVHGDYEKRWQKEGDELYTTVPSLAFPADSRRDLFYAYSQATIEPADHIRLQDVQLAYSPKLTGRLQGKQLRLIMYANNVGILWKATKADRDPDYSTLPPARSFALGIHMNF